eukprot:5509980-Pyramimonas_sp.AAC.1
MGTMNAWKWYSEYCGTRCVYSESTYDAGAVAGLTNEVCKIFYKSKKWHPFVKHVLKLTVPTNDDTPWLLRTMKDAIKLNALTVKFKDSKAFRLSIDPTSPTASTVSDVAMHDAADGAHATTTEVVREATMLDDIVNSLLCTTQAVKDPDMELVGKMAVTCFEYALEGTAVVAAGRDGKLKQFKKWVPLRKAINKILADAHAQHEKVGHGTVDPDVAEQALADTTNGIAEGGGAEAETTETTGGGDDQCVLSLLKQCPKILTRAASFLSNNDATSEKL